MKIRFKKLHPLAETPTRGTPFSAGYDLKAVALERRPILGDGRDLIIYRTGLAVEIPAGYVGLLFPRSSVCKTPLRMSNCVGVIDADYRGEISAVFDAQDHWAASRYGYLVGDRIGQLVIVPFVDVDWDESEELSQTQRGSGGYGSTGR